MIKSSIIRAKLRRSRVSFTDTIFEVEDVRKYNFDDLNLLDNEEIIVFYKTENYRWVLTNFNLFISTNKIKIKLVDLVKIDAENIRKKMGSKKTNTELTLYTKDNSYKVFFEDGTWHVFYNVFLFII